MARLGIPVVRFTKTPNRLLDELAIAGASLPARHRSIVDFLVRESFGWHTASVKASQRAIASRLGVSDRTVREAVADLERWRVVRRRGAGRGRVAVFELLDPRGWRISKTSGAIRLSEARRHARGADQPLLPFSDVASVLDLPTQIRDTSRDRKGDIPRCLAASLVKKRKKVIAEPELQPRARMRRTLSRPGGTVPNDDPDEKAISPEDRAKIRRSRAARLRVRRLRLGNPLDQELVDGIGRTLSEAEIESEIEFHDRCLAGQRESERHRREVENMRHEGKARR